MTNVLKVFFSVVDYNMVDNRRSVDLGVYNGVDPGRCDNAGVGRDG